MTTLETITDTAEIVDSLPASGISRSEAPESFRPLRDSHAFTITVSPVHALYLKSLETTVEYAVTEGLGIAGIGGIGTFVPDARVYEIGGQLRWYPNKRSRWNQMYGIEAFWARIRFDSSDHDGEWDFLEFAANQDFMGVGPFVGWKFMGESGLTLDAQVGLQTLYFYSGGGDRFWLWGFPILNLNVGYVF